jgi:hypothetical protein
MGSHWEDANQQYKLLGDSWSMRVFTKDQFFAKKSEAADKAGAVKR